MKRILAAAATATLLAGGAFAQTAGTEAEAGAGWTMEHGTWGMNIGHMQSTVDAELARLGIAYDTEDLTIRQLNELALILDDDGLSEQEQIDQARAVIEN